MPHYAWCGGPSIVRTDCGIQFGGLAKYPREALQSHTRLWVVHVMHQTAGARDVTMYGRVSGSFGFHRVFDTFRFGSQTALSSNQRR